MTERVALLVAVDRALRREATTLSERPDLLWQQLFNRLCPPGGPALAGGPPPRPWVRLTSRYGEEPALVRVLPGGSIRTDESGRLVAVLHSGAVVDVESGGLLPASTRDRPVEPAETHRLSVRSADGSRLATIGWDGVVRLWSTTDGAAMATAEPGPSEPVALSVNRDGSAIAWSTEDGATIVWDPETAHRTVVAHGWGGRRSVERPQSAVSNDGTLLALAANDDGRVEVWTVLDPRLVARLGDPVEPAVSAARPPLAFSADNRFVAHGGVFGTAVRVWDLRSRELVAELSGLLMLPERIVFAGRGTMLAAEGGNICAWDLATAGRWAGGGLPLAGELGVAAISPSGRHLAFGVEGGEGAVVRLATGTDGGTEVANRDAARPALACPVLRTDGPDLIALAFGTDDEVVAGIDRNGAAYVWDLDGAAQLARIDVAETGEYHDDDQVALSFGPDDSLIAFVIDDVLYVYDWRREEDVVASAVVPSTAWPLDLRWTPDGRFVVLLLRDSVWVLEADGTDWLEGDEAHDVAATAYGHPEGVVRARSFVSLDAPGVRGVRRPGRFDELVRIGCLDGTAELCWPAEAPILDVRYVEPGQRVVVVTVAGTVAILDPVEAG
jgi:WD40 repeat protein